MSTTIRTVRRMPSTASDHDERLTELRGEQREEFESRLRQLCVALTPADTVDVNETEVLSDDHLGAGIGAGLLATADTDHVVLSICGRDRRLRIR